MKIETRALENILNYASDLWNEINRGRQELVITFSGLPASELHLIKSVIAEDSIESSSETFSIEEIDKIKDPIIQISIDMEKLGFASADISGTIENYCEKLRNGFIHKEDIQIIKSPLIISYAESPSEELKAIDIKKECFDLIKKLADSSEIGLVFYSDKFVKIPEYQFSYKITQLFKTDVAKEFIKYFSSKTEEKEICFKDEIAAMADPARKELKEETLFSNLEALLQNTDARYRRFVRRTSEARVVTELNELSQEYLPEISNSIQSMTADILALVGNVTIIANCNFEEPVSIKNLLLLSIALVLTIVFFIISKSRKRHLELVYADLNEAEQDMISHNPQEPDATKIRERISKIMNQAESSIRMFKLLSILIWLPLFAAIGCLLWQNFIMTSTHEIWMQTIVNLI